MSLTLKIGHEQQGLNLAYVSGAPGLRAAIYNELSSFAFVPGAQLAFAPGTDLAFDNPPNTYPGLKIEVI